MPPPAAPMGEVPTGLNAMTVQPSPDASTARHQRSERLLATLARFPRIVLVSHVNPDPDALASMYGLKALVEQCLSGREVILTFDGLIARAENQAMVDLVPIPVQPVESVPIDSGTAIVMVDSQPGTGRRFSERNTPIVVLDHHETPGDLDGVEFLDIRPDLGATSTMVTGYLLERHVALPPRLATALLYGIESEIEGYPREASTLDDGALVWLYPRADKDLLAQIRNPKLPQSHFATFQHALTHASLYRDLVVAWCGPVSQPDIIAEIADFFVRFDQVNWSLAAGVYESMLKLSVRVSLLGEHSGEVLRKVVDGLGNAGGHDRRAGGAIPLRDTRPETVQAVLNTVRYRLLAELQICNDPGRPLLQRGSIHSDA